MGNNDIKDAQCIKNWNSPPLPPESDGKLIPPGPPLAPAPNGADEDGAAVGVAPPPGIPIPMLGIPMPMPMPMSMPCIPMSGLPIGGDDDEDGGGASLSGVCFQKVETHKT